ncbi:hypothetical protein L7F22_063594 [Adiantum nelumboides]|nr:hypothetical protein [Adiantum nelumboides]
MRCAVFTKQSTASSKPRAAGTISSTVMLSTEGFICNETGNSVYTHKQEGVILAVYVDDMIILSPTERGMSWIKGVLHRHFYMTDGGTINYCLGLQVSYQKEKHQLIIKQEQYINNMIKRFRMQDALEVSTSMEMGEYSGPMDELPTDVPYRSLIGSLMYASICTRPDISMAVSRLSRHLEKPTFAHWNAGKRLLRYLKRTSQFGLRYVGCQTEVQCYVDADWAGDIVTRKSTTGVVVTMGNVAILWSSTRQSCVALSTAEAEYMALAQMSLDT